MRKVIRAIFLLALTVLSLAAEQIQLQLGKTMKGNFTTDATQTYSLKYDVAPKSNRLFVRLEGDPSQSFGLPLVTVGNSTAEETCPASGSTRLCQLILNSSIDLKKLSVEVTCFSQCRYQITAWMSEEADLQLGSSLPLRFSKNVDSFYGRLKIPAELAFGEVRILAIVSNGQQVAGGVRLWANLGSNPIMPSTSLHDATGQPIWNEGAGLFLSNKRLKPGEEVRVLVTGDEDVQVSLWAYSILNNQRQISLDQSIQDDVMQNSTKVYKLVLDDIKDFDQATLEVEVTRYSGQTRVSVSADSGFQPERTIVGKTIHFINHLKLSPAIRKDQGFNRTIYVAVSGDRDSTYVLLCSLARETFTMLDDKSHEYSMINGTDVDNYIYPLTLMDTNSSEPQEFSIAVETTSGAVDFGIRRCTEMQGNWLSQSCLLKSQKDVLANLNTFTEISGRMEQRGSIAYFNFDYNVSECARPLPGMLKCVFQIVVYRSEDALSKLASYVIQFERGSRQTVLSEGSTIHDVADANETNNYWFLLTGIPNVVEMKMVLTMLSGDCQLWVANDKRHDNLSDFTVMHAKGNHFSVLPGNLHKDYYAMVSCLEDSFYTLTVAVNRHPIDSYRDHENFIPVTLTESLPQKFKFTSNQTEQTFYFVSNAATDTYVQLTVTDGAARLEVRSSEGFDVSQGHLWSTDTGLLKINNNQNFYSSKNEFVAKVIGQPDTSFEIQFSTQGSCKQHNLNEPLSLHFLSSGSSCLQFKVRKLAELQVVLSYSGLDSTLGHMTMTSKWGNRTPVESHSRVTKFKVEDLKVLCPGLQSSLKSTVAFKQCDLEIQVNAPHQMDALLVVQHIADEIVLLDGVEQPVHGLLSTTQAKHLWWDVADYNLPIFISLRSSTPTDYTVVAKFVTRKDFFTQTGTKLYPKTNDTDVLLSDSGHFRTVNLHIRAADLTRKEQTVLLIAVYSKNVVEEECSFRIEVFQGSSQLVQSQVKMGYLEERDRRQFAIESHTNRSLLVHVNSYGIFCFRMDVLDEQGNYLLQRSIQNDFVIEPTSDSNSYTVQLTGSSACAFEIAYTPVDRKVFELILGRHFRFELIPDEKVYFLYYHADNDAFRVVPMTDYGAVQLRIRELPKGALADMDNYLKKLDSVWDNISLTNAPLTVNTKEPLLCSECYYLIEVSSPGSAAAVRLVLHRTETPLVIKPRLILREVLDGDTLNITYALYERASYNVTFEIFEGELMIEAVHTTNPEFKEQSRLIGSGVVQLLYPNDTDNSNKSLSLLTGEAFLVRVSCPNRCSYSMVAHNKIDFARQTIDGLPISLLIESAEKMTCSQFLSMQGRQSIQLSILAENTSLLNDSIRLIDRKTWGDIKDEFVLARSISPRQINVELKSLNGYYLVCLKLTDKNAPPMHVSMMHSSQHRPIIANHNSEYLMAVPEPLTFELYNPSNRVVMIEVFECRGRVRLRASTDYLELMQNGSNQAEHSKTAGHYIVQLDHADADANMFYARVDPVQSKLLSEQNVKIDFRFLTFEPHAHPYRMVGTNDYTIAYQTSGGKLVVKLQAVRTNKYYRLVETEYRLYAARQQDTVREAAQCGIGNLYNQTRIVGTNDIDGSHEITFEVDVDDLDDILPFKDSYVYVGVSCLAKVVEPETDKEIELRFMYEELQLTVLDMPVGRMFGLKNVSKLLVLWILLPMVFILLLLWRTLLYCCHWCEQFRRERYLLDADESRPKHQLEPDQVLTQTVTMKNLVLACESRDQP